MHWPSCRWACLSPESLTLPGWKKDQVIEWKLSEVKWFLGAVQISMNSCRSVASYFSSAQLVRACWHVFGKLHSTKLKQQLQVQQEKSFRLVLFEMVARRVSREFCVTWTSKHCVHISARTHSKCKIEKPKSQMSKNKKPKKNTDERGKESRGPVAAKSSDCASLFALPRRDQGCQEEGRIFDAKKKKDRIVLSNLTLWACDFSVGGSDGKKQLTSWEEAQGKKRLGP